MNFSAYVKNGSYNLITADYPTLMKERCDRVAQLNAEPISQCTAHVFKYFKARGVNIEQFSCVGFSIGAHICGLVANHIEEKMERIVGQYHVKFRLVCSLFCLENFVITFLNFMVDGILSLPAKYNSNFLDKGTYRFLETANYNF
jgi:hypothetical protein